MKKLIALMALGMLTFQIPAQTLELLSQKDFQAEKKKIYDNFRITNRQLNEVRKADATG